MLSWTRKAFGRPIGIVRVPHGQSLAQYTFRSYSAKNHQPEEHPEFDYAAAREWYKDFNPVQTLGNIGEVTYSRSSGPGGQNVNKYT